MTGDDETLRIPEVFPDEELGPAAPKVLPIAPPRSAAQLPSRYRQSAGASLLAAGLLGLRDVIEPPKDDRPVLEQHAADDDPDRPVEVYLDPDDPASSLVVIRNRFEAN
jgi:hypothetical protein